MAIRNRIVRHARVRAGDLIPHELNPRQHGDLQRKALEAIYAEIGFARSLLAYQLPDGRLKLIDGHLRAEVDPDQEVEVEILDVTDAEARALLLTIDPLAQLATYDDQLLSTLQQQADTDSDLLRDLWDGIRIASEQAEALLEEQNRPQVIPEQYLILVTCQSEDEQRQLLERFDKEGLVCKALVS